MTVNIVVRPIIMREINAAMKKINFRLLLIQRFTCRAWINVLTNAAQRNRTQQKKNERDDFVMMESKRQVHGSEFEFCLYHISEK